MTEFKFSYEAMGCEWQVSIWDDLPRADLEKLQAEIVALTSEFDATYSRFKRSSLIWQLAYQTGIFAVPEDLVAMLKYYFQFYDLSDQKFSPLIGETISDMGYDDNYSLVPKAKIAVTPPLVTSLRIIDGTHIELLAPVLLDLGGVGKGYWVDRLAAYLRRAKVKRFLVNGSGDMVYESGSESMTIGLEDPRDASQVIGTVVLKPGKALCSSGSNRRRWDKYHHIIDPTTQSSPDFIVATWVIADSATVADALASCLFLVPPTSFETRFEFDYCVMNNERKVRRSEGFEGELF